ncbi:MAG TPA: hypothetical protein VHD89_13745 [Rhodanobacteraceae bacterium]|jgi:hypothetical protein|nr:hypothetical protein [Rhodanobacteraceae bacterium]
MIDWLLSLPRATWRQRFWALLLLLLVWFNAASEWSNLHAGLAVAHWIAWFTVAAAIFATPLCLLVLPGNRAPCWFGIRSGSLTKTLPQIHEEIRFEHEERERNSRRF